MAKLRRIDAELVRRKLAPSRTKAQEMIQAGYVKLDGEVVYKPARQMDPAQAIVVDLNDSPDYASRGAYKLAGALEILGEKAPQIKDKRCLDAGASTGGFTDVLLRNGAASVVAADVGYGQLIWRLQNDPRVEVRDRTNVRQLQAGDIEPAPQVVVSDLSFISLTLVLDALKDVAASDADFLLMVKPQFEVGKDKLGSGGVVRNLDHHHEAVSAVVRYAMKIGLHPYGLAASPLPGPAGNVEYFVALKAVAQDFSEGATPAVTVEAENNRVVEFINEAELDVQIWEAINAGPAKTNGKIAGGVEHDA
ncbi:putative ribosomal RNA large subunit methyltransferase J [Gleimia coleocanis DSM 15436]|uniref:Putative ribosomal RNA large subunit methyltransferase J n=1 Tax=Gleimia coleocanis DSM 15436 TaxID=525245 RepID=C0VZ81_9ACTO|nr:TlyA family RNA methyltransferase [Gleimia coleocanis]EEH64182.1 putative ribosomal RNA large subunit methyltransferase J [Gleimia coleocanis DSM 15436]